MLGPMLEGCVPLENNARSPGVSKANPEDAVLLQEEYLPASSQPTAMLRGCMPIKAHAANLAKGVPAHLRPPPWAALKVEMCFSSLGCKPCCVQADGTDLAAFEAVPLTVSTMRGNPQHVEFTDVLVASGEPLVWKEEQELDTGARYVGEWQGAHFHGKGSLTMPDGSKYDGQFHSGRAHGNGRFQGVNGDSYVVQREVYSAHVRGKYV